MFEIPFTNREPKALSGFPQEQSPRKHQKHTKTPLTHMPFHLLDWSNKFSGVYFVGISFFCLH